MGIINIKRDIDDEIKKLILEREGYLARDAKVDSVNSKSTFSLDTYVLNPNSTYGGNDNVRRGKASRTPDSIAQNPYLYQQRRDPIGGNLLIEGSLQLIFKLPMIEDQRSMRSAFFLDFGNHTAPRVLGAAGTSAA